MIDLAEVDEDLGVIIGDGDGSTSNNNNNQFVLQVFVREE